MLPTTSCRSRLLVPFHSARYTGKRMLYRRIFDRWQDRVKAVEQKRKLEESNRRYLKNTTAYLSPEVENFAPPGSDQGNLTIAQRGGNSLETVYYHSRLRYLDLSATTVRLYEEYQKLIARQYDQRFIPERHLLLGPDLAAAHFIIHRGGAVKFLGDERWHKRNEKDEYYLPGSPVPGLSIEAIDASGTEIMFEGLGNLVDLEKIRFLSLSNCKYINDFAISRLSQFQGSLELLDLSRCSKLSAQGLSSLSCLKKLKYLRLDGMDHVKNVAKAALLLEDTIPGLTVIGLDYEALLEDCERQMELLAHENVVQDAKGNVFAKDLVGELYYLVGNLAEHSVVAEHDLPVFIGTIRKDPPDLPLETTEELNQLSNGKLKHLLAGSPSGEWSQETERVLQVDARRAMDEGRSVHQFLRPKLPDDTSVKAALERFAIRSQLLEKGETLRDVIGLPEKQDAASLSTTETKTKPQMSTVTPTCTTCRLVFETAQLQTAHHQSKWHLYNLQRKLVSLEPVTLSEFEEKAAEHEKAPVEVTQEHICIPCGKKFHSFGSYQSHLQSKRHLNNDKLFTNREGVEMPEQPKSHAMAEKGEAKIDEEKCEVDATLVCLFCNRRSDDLQQDLNHMVLAHGFFIPNSDYCCDVSGFLQCLYEKISVRHYCLWCSYKGKAFPSAAAAQTHMKDKGHCKIYRQEDAFAEYIDFYDYTRVVAEDSDDQADDDSDAESLADYAMVAEDGYHLYLPSGAVAGHRSLFRYYRQNLPSGTSNESRPIAHHEKNVNWTKANAQRSEHKFRTKRGLKVDVKSNKLQRHFRKQVMC